MSVQERGAATGLDYVSEMQYYCCVLETNWHSFREKFFDSACFSVHEVYAWRPQFDRNNLSRWVRQRRLIRLRRGMYTFPEYGARAGFAVYFASRVYRPSYISLHTALSFYGLIPEAVTQITSVTSLKTAHFDNEIAEYSYKSVRANLMFGYMLRELAPERAYPFATREKALLDLLYLYPACGTRGAMLELRLDGDVLHDDLDLTRLGEQLSQFHCGALERRVSLLKEVYAL